MNFKHWIGITVLVFVILYVYNAQTFKSVPLIGGFVSS